MEAISQKYSEKRSLAHAVNQNITLFTLPPKRKLRKLQYVTVPIILFSEFSPFLEYAQTDITVFSRVLLYLRRLLALVFLVFEDFLCLLGEKFTTPLLSSLSSH